MKQEGHDDTDSLTWILSPGGTFVKQNVPSSKL